MTFQPIKFTFIPPTTVPLPPPAAPPAIAPNPAVGGATSGAQSNAGQLITILNNMTDMSKYLQSAILALTGQMGIEIDPAVDPDTARALIGIYGTPTAPPVVTIGMYNAILDAAQGVQQLQTAVGQNSSIQPNPMQHANLLQVISAINKSLVQSASYTTWLPLQLAGLKADAVVFQGWAASLATYPAYYASAPNPSVTPPPITASGVDMSSSLFSYQSDAISRFGQTYAAVYTSLASPSPVEQDVNNVVSQLISQPLSAMVQMQGLFTSLVGLQHKPAMATLTGDPMNYTFSRLSADVSGMLTNADQLVTMAASPLQGTLGGLSTIVAGVQAQASTLGTVQTGALTGMSNGNSCAAANPSNGLTMQSGGTSVTANTSLTVPGIGAVTEGVKQLAETINMGTSTLQNGLSALTTSFQQLVEHRVSQQNDLQSLMCSMRTVGLLMGLVSGVINATQAGSVTSNPSPQQQQEAANSILTSLSTKSTTTFTTSGGQIIVAPPTLPPVTPGAQAVLSAAKIRVPLGTIVS